MTARIDVLKRDHQAQIGSLVAKPNFVHFVNSMDSILGTLLDERLTINTLMEAQYRCLDFLIEQSAIKPPVLMRLRQSVSEFEEAQTFLWALNLSEEEYCKQAPGMTADEYSLMKIGELTVGDLVTTRPAVIIAPLLRKQTTRH